MYGWVAMNYLRGMLGSSPETLTSNHTKAAAGDALNDSPSTSSVVGTALGLGSGSDVGSAGVGSGRAADAASQRAAALLARVLGTDAAAEQGGQLVATVGRQQQHGRHHIGGSLQTSGSGSAAATAGAGTAAGAGEDEDASARLVPRLPELVPADATLGSLDLGGSSLEVGER